MATYYKSTTSHGPRPEKDDLLWSILLGNGDPKGLTQRGKGLVSTMVKNLSGIANNSSCEETRTRAEKAIELLQKCNPKSLLPESKKLEIYNTAYKTKVDFVRNALLRNPKIIATATVKDGLLALIRETQNKGIKQNANQALELLNKHSKTTIGKNQLRAVYDNIKK